MTADIDPDPTAPLTITRATAVLFVPGARPWIALRRGPELLGVPLSPASSRDCSRPKRTRPTPRGAGALFRAAGA